MTAPGRTVLTTGCRHKPSGMMAGPSGLAEPAERLRFMAGFLAALAVEPAFSSAPPRIQARMICSLASGSLSWLGGILGSSVWLTRPHSREPSGSPGATTSPLAPPCMRAAKVSIARSLFLVSWLWQVAQCSRRIGRTCSS